MNYFALLSLTLFMEMIQSSKVIQGRDYGSFKTINYENERACQLRAKRVSHKSSKIDAARYATPHIFTETSETSLVHKATSS